MAQMEQQKEAGKDPAVRIAMTTQETGSQDRSTGREVRARVRRRDHAAITEIETKTMTIIETNMKTAETVIARVGGEIMMLRTILESLLDKKLMNTPFYTRSTMQQSTESRISVLLQTFKV